VYIKSFRMKGTHYVNPRNILHLIVLIPLIILFEILGPTRFKKIMKAKK